MERPHLGSLRFESFRIDGRVGADRRFPVEFEASFPLAVRTYEFPDGSTPVPMTWHERLELFCPISGHGAFRMGANLWPFRAGDIVIVDHLRLHGVERYEGRKRRAVVVTFLPSLVAGPGALPCDNLLLGLFWAPQQDRPLILRASAGGAAESRAAVAELALLAAHDGRSLARQAAMKSKLVALLLQLNESLGPQIQAGIDLEARRDRMRRLAPLLDHLRTHLTERVTVRAAARRLGMSESYFMRFFRETMGLSFIAWINQVRLAEAHRLLLSSDRQVCAIANETGFCDQSYFDRRFRRRFGVSPTEIRLRARKRASA